MCPTVFYGGDGEELAFFVEDAREPRSQFRLYRVPVTNSFFQQITRNLESLETRQKVLQRNNIAGCRLGEGHGAIDSKVARSDSSERFQMSAASQLLANVLCQAAYIGSA